MTPNIRMHRSGYGGLRPPPPPGDAGRSASDGPAPGRGLAMLQVLKRESKASQ